MATHSVEACLVGESPWIEEPGRATVQRGKVERADMTGAAKHSTRACWYVFVITYSIFFWERKL